MASNVVASGGIAEIYSVHVLARELDTWTDRQARPSGQSDALPLLRVEECGHTFLASQKPCGIFVRRDPASITRARSRWWSDRSNSPTSALLARSAWQ